MAPRTRLLAISFFMLFSSHSGATIDSCAVTKMTPDGFVALRSGPGVNFTIVRKVLPTDGLYGDFTECRKSAGIKAPLCDRSGN